MKLKIYTLGINNGDGSCSIECYSTKKERDNHFDSQMEDDPEIEPYCGEETVELEMDKVAEEVSFKPFSIYTDGI